jgi:hypothetical protein
MIPPAFELTAEQYAGRSCCWCARVLTHGAVSAGIARGRLGAHVLDVEVYACPGCAADRPVQASALPLLTPGPLCRDGP